MRKYTVIHYLWNLDYSQNYNKILISISSLLPPLSLISKLYFGEVLCIIHFILFCFVHFTILNTDMKSDVIILLSYKIHWKKWSIKRNHKKGDSDGWKLSKITIHIWEISILGVLKKVFKGYVCLIGTVYLLKRLFLNTLQGYYSIILVICLLDFMTCLL